MNTRYWTKTALYSAVDRLRSNLVTPGTPFPLNAKLLARDNINPLMIVEIPFPSYKICGILYKGARKTSIALNASRTTEMQNYDCMHELIHYFLHDISYCQCICSDGSSQQIKQDSIQEWQANEGAAQFLVPYQDFIPQFVSLLEYKSIFSDTNILRCLAERYGVTEQVISFRINNLSYEIDQYRNGASIDTIDLLSANQQRKKGIVPTGYADACEYRISIGHPLARDAMIG